MGLGLWARRLWLIFLAASIVAAVGIVLTCMVIGVSLYPSAMALIAGLAVLNLLLFLGLWGLGKVVDRRDTM